MAKRKNNYEYEQQCKVIAWCDARINQCAGLGMVFGSANGGSRSSKMVANKYGALVRISPEGMRLKKSGVRAGDPDLRLPIPMEIEVRHYSGLYIEMKAIDFSFTPKLNKPIVEYGKTSDEQKKIQNNLKSFGHKVVTCYSADTIDRTHGGKRIQHIGAIDVICEYLGLDRGMLEVGRRYPNWHELWATKMGIEYTSGLNYADEGFDDELPDFI